MLKYYCRTYGLHSNLIFLGVTYCEYKKMENSSYTMRFEVGKYFGVARKTERITAKTKKEVRENIWHEWKN